ncbi:MAG: T9SS type A sorting domain-containing protein [Ignavibacteriales bacterium]|nr:T9SS type A sorting domain-containing protein [Ignavibacteriales bacterium]
MKRIILTFAVLIISFIHVKAQWTDLSPNLPDSIENISDIYFLTEEIGLISCKNLSIWPNFQRYIYRTTDGGGSWLISFHDIVNQQENYKFNFINPDTGWAFSENKLLKTTDGGQSWSLQSLPVFPSPMILKIYSIHFINNDTGWAGGVVIISQYPNDVRNDIIFRTTDGGTSWLNVFQIQAVMGIRKIFFAPGNRGYATNSEFFYRTYNGINWAKINNSVHNSDFIFTDQSNGWAVGFDYTNSKISKTSNSGNIWNQQYTLPDTALNRLFFINSMKGFCVGDHGKILFTSDGGLNWKNEYIGTNCNLKAINFLNEQIGYCGGQNYLFKTTNGGSVTNQIVFSEDSIYIPTLSDSGFTKIVNSSDYPVRIDSIISVGSFYGYWGNFSKPGFEYPFYLFQTMPGFMGDTLGIIILPHDSINVSFFNVDLCPICDYEVQDYFKDTLKFVFTFIDGNVYSFNKSIPISGEGHPSDIVDEDVLPSKFILEQNYPNPFNPSTCIQYAISSRQFVTLKVYDVLGNEVATLVNEYCNAGNYEVDFDAGKIASGVYYYQLKTGDFVETKKMILLR